MYIVVRTHRRIIENETEQRHPVVFMHYDDDMKFEELIDAIIARKQQKHPEDFLILQAWG